MKEGVRSLCRPIPVSHSDLRCCGAQSKSAPQSRTAEWAPSCYYVPSGGWADSRGKAAADTRSSGRSGILDSVRGRRRDCWGF
jgi:hypothetical protein